MTFDTKVDSGVTNYRYQVWYNYSLTVNLTSDGSSDVYGNILPLTRAIDEAILSVSDNPNPIQLAKMNVNLRDWPQVPPRTIPDAVISQLGATFFYCTSMIIFISVLNTIVSEKEMKLKTHMHMIGLMPTVYWLSWTISSAFLVAVSSLFTSIIGLILGFEAFKNTNFGVIWITFFLFGMAMVYFAFFLSSVTSKTRTAVLVGIFVFVIGLLFQSFVFSNIFIGYIWWDEPTGSAGWGSLMFLPFFNFGKMFLDISTLTVGRFDSLTETYVAGPGFSWESLFESLPDNLLPVYNAAGRRPKVPPPVQTWHFLIMNIVVYGALAIYLDQVLPNEFGQRKEFLFFLRREFWGLKTIEDPEIPKDSDPTDAEEEPDVRQERDRVYSATDADAQVRLINLCKSYYPDILQRGTPVKAVNRLCLALKEGQLLAFLGQNGAGKSTTMNMLAGLLTPTAGNALVYGNYLTRDIEAISRMMGCCPQHDVLFPDLTAREHVEIYAGLKGIDHRSIEKLMEERLAAVKLASVANEMSRTFSGGMKRRLSLILSTIGDPKVLYLDEPTTGMDPVNRRHVWSFIEKFKTDRVVILTSHSMEEVEVLGDRIGVMVKGKLRALANPIQLRNRFGMGYRISVMCHSTDAEKLKKSFEQRLPSAILEDDHAGALLYQVPLQETDKVPDVVSWLEENPDGIVNGWGMSQTTLEEVFLKIVRKYAGDITDPSFQMMDETLQRSRSNIVEKPE